MGGRAGSEITVAFEGGSLDAPVLGRVLLGPKPGWTAAVLPPALEIGGPFGVSLAVGSLPESIEGARGKPQDPLPLPPDVTMNGRLSAPGEVDTYVLDVEAGGSWSIRVDAARLGSWLDPVLGVLREDGTSLASADDEGTSPDPRLDFTPPEGVKKVLVQVSDLTRRGGKAFTYRLTAARSRPDFALRLGTTQLDIPLEGTAAIEVECVRSRFTGAVKLAVDSEPAGFEVRAGEILPDQTKGHVTITGRGRGRPAALDLEVVGTGVLERGDAAAQIVRRAHGTVFLATEQNVPVSPWRVSSVVAAVATPSVLEEFGRLQAAEAGEDQPGDFAALVEHGLLFLVEKPGEGVQGFVRSNFSDGKYVHAGGLYVHPRHRGKGAGRGGIELGPEGPVWTGCLASQQVLS